MRGRSRKSEERFNVWPGFTDVMVGLLLVFVLVVTLFTISETILGRSLSKKDIELARLKKEAAEKTLEIERLRKERDVKSTEAEGLSRDIAKRITEIEILTREADEKASEIETLRSDVYRKVEEIEGLRKDIALKTAEAARLAQELASKGAEAQNLLWQNELKGGALERLKVEIDRLEQLAADQRSKIANLEDLFAARTKELETATTDIQTKTALLARSERRISELDTQLGKRGAELTGARGEIAKKAQSIHDLNAALEAQNKRIAELNKRMAKYAEEVKRLNGLLAEAKTAEAAHKTKAASLQKEIVTLHAKLEEIGAKLSAAKEDAKKKFKISQLVGLLGEKEKEIERLRKLAKYRSEFLAKLESVFTGVPDIKVQGDRFVFQSEILFASGSAIINEAGKKELDKFIRIYKEMESKVPKDLDLIILVQGYTDTDPVRSSRYRSNWELSSERALQVVRYMIEKGVPPTALGASALGEFHPASKKETPEAKRLNRRIEIKITTL